MSDFELNGWLAERLMTAAREAASNAYVPYSQFPVGAAILTAGGAVVTGANIEIASYGLTCCAERTAAFTAAAAGHREFLAVAVTAPRLSGVTPCGACRQVLEEFHPKAGEMAIILDDANGVTRTTLAELLPRAFGPRSLEQAADPSV